ncbi:MAG: hydroxymethylbilane synthase, partial [Oscillospiraceae bacterium]|nr:hydroxymethylbilane synthase [Oscillospiraceae bacterium]
VLTRLEKLDNGEFGALVLAAAGLRRLGLEGRIHRYFTLQEMLPAAGQGILAVQCRRDMDTSFLDCVRDRDAELCARAERAFIRALDGGCSSPVAAHAVIEGESMKISGLFVDINNKISRGLLCGIPEQGESLGTLLAEKLKEEAA